MNYLFLRVQKIKKPSHSEVVRNWKSQKVLKTIVNCFYFHHIIPLSPAGTNMKKDADFEFFSQAFINHIYLSFLVYLLLLEIHVQWLPLLLCFPIMDINIPVPFPFFLKHGLMAQPRYFLTNIRSTNNVLLLPPLLETCICIVLFLVLFVWINYI
jgi:hypothetical protein